MVDELVAPHSVWMDGLDVFEIHVLRQHCGDAVREFHGGLRNVRPWQEAPGPRGSRLFTSTGGKRGKRRAHLPYERRRERDPLLLAATQKHAAWLEKPPE
jgi:hypothetical protein